MPREKSLMVELPKEVHRVRSRGREYYYWHPGRGTKHAGPRTRLPDNPHSSEFWTQIDELKRSPTTESKTINALIEAYKRSPEFRDKAKASQDSYLHFFSMISRIWGKRLAASLTTERIVKSRDEIAATKPATANQMVRTLSLLFKWGIQRGYRQDNPCYHIDHLVIGEYDPWPDWAIQRVRAEAPEYLRWAMEVALYTGQRQGDCLRMRWSDIESDIIAVKQGKTGKQLWIPLHRDFRPILKAIPKRSTHILTTLAGVPWKQGGFRSSWNDYVLKAVPGLEEHKLVFHGLRKTATCKLAEAGCSEHEIAAITGQSLQVIQHYTKGANRRLMAQAAVLKWERSENAK